MSSAPSSPTIFSVIGATLDASEFVTGTAAQDADDYIIYNTGNGKLYYDADGNGAGSKVQIAKLTTIPTIDQDDFLMAA